MLRILFQTFKLKSTIICTKTASVETAQNVQTRTFALTSNQKLKEIQQTTEGNITKIEGKIVPSERAQVVMKTEEHFTGCTLCKIHPYLKYTDVLILSQFLRPDGCLLPRWVTGVCKKQQFKLASLINQAQRAGLLPQFRKPLPSGKSRTSHMSNYKWKRYNVYFKN